jgi:hypothetical protein
LQVYPPPSPVINVQPSPAPGVSDWIKLPIVAILSLAGGMLLERSRKRGNLEQMENSVYKELARNYSILVGTLETVQINSGPGAVSWSSVLDAVRTDRYRLAKAGFLFDEISGSSDLDQLYAAFDILHSITDSENKLAFAESLVARIEDHIDKNKLDRKKFGKYIMSDLIRQRLKL